MVSAAADIDRTPNPGVEYPPPERTLARVDSFGDWAERYAVACAQCDWRTVWAAYGRAVREGWT